MREIPADIFKARDIRGIVGSTPTREIAKLIGRDVGSQARHIGQSSVVVGRDGRLSSPELASALIAGLRQTGIEVIDIGMVSAPMAYFAAHYPETGAAAMVTGSHNPPGYKGIKIVLGWPYAVRSSRPCAAAPRAGPYMKAKLSSGARMFSRPTFAGSPATSNWRVR